MADKGSVCEEEWDFPRWSKSSWTPLSGTNGSLTSALATGLRPIRAVGSLLTFKLTGNALPAATILKMAGIPDQAIQELLGHASVGTTREIYLHLTPEAEKGAAEKMDEIFGPVAARVALPNIKTRPS